MESNSKSGEVYLRPRKAGKKWKPVWLSLVPPSSSGAGRLEIQDLGGTVMEHGLKRHQVLGERKPKVVRLSELLNVLRLPPNAEACPMENMCAFCVETQDMTLVFSALKDDCADWVDKLCLSTFQKQNVSGSTTPQMEENVLYASADHVSPSGFQVVVQRTDAAARCGLQGAYWLHVEREALLLKDSGRSTVQEWRYELLRRYGRDKDSLTIETGRRCDCGPGTLMFQTRQAETIFSLIQSTIKRKTTHTAPSAGHAAETDPPTPLNARPLTPDLSNMSAIFETKCKAKEPSDEASHPAPITLMPLPSLPNQEPPPHSSVDNVYADPIDCLKPARIGTSLYVDPACILPLRPPGNMPPPPDKQHSEYAEVFSKVSGERIAAGGERRAAGGEWRPAAMERFATNERFTSDEPIYSEPVREGPEEDEDKKKKADEFAHLYAQVCKTAKRSPSPKPRPLQKETDPDGDIIYETLGII